VIRAASKFPASLSRTRAFALNIDAETVDWARALPFIKRTKTSYGSTIQGSGIKCAWSESMASVGLGVADVDRPPDQARSVHRSPVCRDRAGGCTPEKRRNARTKSMGSDGGLGSLPRVETVRGKRTPHKSGYPERNRENYVPVGPPQILTRAYTSCRAENSVPRRLPQ